MISHTCSIGNRSDDLASQGNMLTLRRAHCVIEVGENRCNSHRLDDEPNKGSGQTNTGIWSAVIRVEKIRSCAKFPFIWLKGVPATAHQNAWFMHDGAPAHFSIAVRYNLNVTYPDRWIGCSGPVS
ncbi:hypothetical protein TNCV_2004071 [Trichonephila clavipes]|nr:hypothetical protein TNCV_2004071 [Trichonephila clavipes]